MNVNNADMPNVRITGLIIGAAIEVHRELGPGLLEATYEECLAYELAERKLKVEFQLSLDGQRHRASFPPAPQKKEKLCGLCGLCGDLALPPSH